MNRIRKGDQVIVITGKYKGQKGNVLRVREDRVVVENVNLVKRHTKPNPQANKPGGIIEREASIHASNVMLFNPASGKGERIGYKTLDDGRKVRVFRSGEVVDACAGDSIRPATAAPAPGLWLYEAPTGERVAAMIGPQRADDRSLAVSGRPPCRTMPPSSGSTPPRHSNSVVLPDPLGPMRPRISPSRIEKDTSCSAVSRPYRLVRFVA